LLSWASFKLTGKCRQPRLICPLTAQNNTVARNFVEVALEAKPLMILLYTCGIKYISEM